MAKKYDYVVFIGRFQPFHFGHQYVIKEALQYGKKVIILCGTLNPEILDDKNPWLFTDRQKMINSSFTDNEAQNLIICRLNDILASDEKWINSAYQIIDNVTNNSNNIALIGHFKDESSYYLKLFNKWPIITVENYHGINATDVRTIIDNRNNAVLTELLPANVIGLLNLS
jgi:bifunctional NMN adenylyltransferase/nudix hydrolase